MSKWHYLSMSTDISCLLLCIIGIIIIYIWKNAIGKSGKYSLFIFISLASSVVAHFLGLLFKGQSGVNVHNILIATNFVEFAFEYITSYAFTSFLINSIETAGEPIKKRYKTGILIYYIFTVMLLVISQFTNWFYYIDAGNFYRRTEHFYVSQISAIVFMIIDTALLIAHGKHLRKNERILMYIYIFLPVIAVVIQIFIYGLNLFLLSSTIVIVIMFLVTLSMQVKEYYIKENQLSNMKMLLTLSQIKPHFLYNSLTTIKYLCKSNPETAAETIDKFSLYLRENMEAINTKHCISFEKELEHVKNYLSIEKLRFANRLHVSFDIKEKNFILPPLSLQPIVENAVKYGTKQKMAGVSICIKSYRDDENFYIKVTDDGAGFDVNDYKGDGNMHIGIDSVTSRLNAMCNGNISISSIKDKGTTVTISIPKGEGVI